MAFIILLSRWTKQPTRLVQLDWSNPLKNLVGAYSAMPLWVRQGRDAIFRVPSGTPAGPATNPSQLLAYPTRAGVVAARIWNSSTPTVVHNLIGTHAATTSITLFSLFIPEGVTNNQIVSQVGPTDMRPGLREGAGGIVCANAEFRTNVSTTISATGTVALTAGVVYPTAIRRIQGDGLYLHVVGVEDVYTASAANMSGVPSTLIAHSGNANSPEPPLSLVWSRALSTTEIAELAKRPWQIFRPVLRRIFFPTSAAAVSIALDATEAPDVFDGALNLDIGLNLAATEAADTFSGALNLDIAVALSATEAADTFAGTLVLANQAVALAATEAADEFAGAINLDIAVSLAATEQPDVFAGTLIVGSIEVSLSATEGSDTFSGRLGRVITGGGGGLTTRPEISLLRRKQLEEDEILMRFITEFVQSGRIEQ